MSMSNYTTHSWKVLAKLVTEIKSSRVTKFLHVGVYIYAATTAACKAKTPV